MSKINTGKALKFELFISITNNLFHSMAYFLACEKILQFFLESINFQK